MKTCKKCGCSIPSKILYKERVRNLSRRKYCLSCSPFGGHNTRNLAETQLFKVCPHCEKEKSADQFYRRSSRDGKNLSGYCKECTNQTTVERQKATKLKAVAFMGGACQKCGYSAYAGALEFHHTNPAKKDFQIGAKGTRSFESIKKELLKCVLLCSNCHKEEHNKKGS